MAKYHHVQSVPSITLPMFHTLHYIHHTSTNEETTTIDENLSSLTELSDIVDERKSTLINMTKKLSPFQKQFDKWRRYGKKEHYDCMWDELTGFAASSNWYNGMKVSLDDLIDIIETEFKADTPNIERYYSKLMNLNFGSMICRF
jgi:hypothetical protein